MLSTHQAQEVLGVRGYIGKNPSPTSVKNKVKIVYISERQPSPYELAFGFEIGLNSHSKDPRYKYSYIRLNVFM